jgi:hypothetical protein
MTINVVKDKSGKVIASFEAASGTGPTVVPVLTDGATVAQVEVADKYKENLKALYPA